MTAVAFWLLIIAVGWLWATNPARQTTQDRQDLQRIRAAQRRVMR